MYMDACQFNLCRLVISAWNKHIHLNTIFKWIVNVWWCSDVMHASKPGPLVWGDTCHGLTRMAGPNGVLSSQASVYSVVYTDENSALPQLTDSTAGSLLGKEGRSPWHIVCGSFLTCKDFGRACDHSFPACAFFFFFFLKWRLVCAH